MSFVSTGLNQVHLRKNNSYGLEILRLKSLIVETRLRHEILDRDLVLGEFHLWCGKVESVNFFFKLTGEPSFLDPWYSTSLETIRFKGS